MLHEQEGYEKILIKLFKKYFSLNRWRHDSKSQGIMGLEFDSCFFERFLV